MPKLIQRLNKKKNALPLLNITLRRALFSLADFLSSIKILNIDYLKFGSCFDVTSNNRNFC